MNVNNNNNNNNNNHNNHSNSNGTSNGNINSNGKGGSFTSKAAVGGVLQPIALRIFLDHSMLEVFTSTGQVSGMNALLAVALLMCAVLPLLRIFNGGAGVYLNALCALAGLTTSSARTNTHRTYTHAHDHHLHVTLCANPDFPCLPLQGSATPSFAEVELLTTLRSILQCASCEEHGWSQAPCHKHLVLPVEDSEGSSMPDLVKAVDICLKWEEHLS
eukprot:scaffold57640_cov19-Tisochrysis_lutea.AAC.1